jgi:hypothetical protein
VELRPHTDERLNREWRELYERLKLALLEYGEDHIDEGDYYLVEEQQRLREVRVRRRGVPHQGRVR